MAYEMQCGHGRWGWLGLVRPFPREWGTVFPSVVCAVKWKGGAGGGVPSHTGQRGQMARGGARDDRERGRHAVHPPSMQMWKGMTRVACPRMPLCRANGVARAVGRGGAKGDKERGRRAPQAHLPRKQGREGWYALACPLPTRTGWCSQGEGEGGGMWRLSQGTGRWRRERGWCAPHVHLFHANGKGGAGGGVPLCAPLHGRGGKRGTGDNRERGQCHPFHPNGEGRRWGALAQMGREGPGREGEGGGGVPSCAPLLYEWAGDKEGGRHALVRSPFLHRKGWQTVREGRGKRRGGITLSMWGEGEDEGATYPGAPLSACEWAAHDAGDGGGDGRATGMGGTRGMLFAHPYKLGGSGMVGKEGWRASGTQPLIVGPPTSPLLSSLPYPLIRAKRGHKRTGRSPCITRREGCKIRGTQCPPPPNLPGPPFSPSMPPRLCGRRAHKGSTRPPGPSLPFAQKGGVQEHSAPPPCPIPLVRATPFAQSEGMQGQDMRKGDTRGHATLPPLLPHLRGREAREGTLPHLSALSLPSSPSLFTPPCSCGKGACEPPAICAEGGARWHIAPPLHVSPTPSLCHTTGMEVHNGTPPHLSASAPPPSLPSYPFMWNGCTRARHAERGHMRAHVLALPFPIRAEGGCITPPCSPCRPRPFPFPLRTTCEGKPPRPVVPCSCGKGRTRPS
ncbi:hypothetical protein EDB84DRAFT_1434112 [Lactarius hengduanensis]|nr:hypothetical protein EDB84DRAFT_1434112 [Lactarius hengduanensis]